MVQVANPIYDNVFKYIMEDERIAKTILNVFDQTRMDANHHILNIDETQYTDNDDVLYILRRLREAASDSQLRHDMNVEDEYFSAIENRDTEILLRDKQLAEQRTQLDEQRTQLDEQKTQLDEQKTQLAAKDSQLAASIKLMLSQNIPSALIAQTLGISVEDVDALK